MTNTVMKPAWARATLRLDPTRFPQQVSYAIRDSSGDVTITIDERGAVLRKILPSSGLPKRAFKGVAARAIDHGNGEVTVTLELHHDDPDLCIPLLVAHDLSDIAADRRSWSEAFRIPMLMVEADGVARPLEEHLGEIRTNEIKPRRRHSYFADHPSDFATGCDSGCATWEKPQNLPSFRIDGGLKRSRHCS